MEYRDHPPCCFISDINECETDIVEDQHNCAAGSTNLMDSGEAITQAKCHNMDGSFECLCDPGYMLGATDDADAFPICEGKTVHEMLVVSCEQL